MNSRLLLPLLSLAAVMTAKAATLIDATYTTSTTLTATDWFLEGTTATWTINSGVTVTTSTNRFFIGTTTAPNTGIANFVITGGGTFLDTNTNQYAFRLGQNGGAEPGQITVSGGSTFQMTPGGSANNTGLWAQSSGSALVLNGIGSTAILKGVYTSTTSTSGTYQSGNTSIADAVAINVSSIGGSILSSYDAGTNVTTLTVAAVPEPSTYGLMGAGTLAAAAFVRRRRQKA